MAVTQCRIREVNSRQSLIPLLLQCLSVFSLRSCMRNVQGLEQANSTSKSSTPVILWPNPTAFPTGLMIFETATSITSSNPLNYWKACRLLDLGEANAWGEIYYFPPLSHSLEHHEICIDSFDDCSCCQRKGALSK